MYRELTYVALIEECYVNIPLDEPEGYVTTLLLSPGNTIKLEEGWASSYVENGELALLDIQEERYKDKLAGKDIRKDVYLSENPEYIKSLELDEYDWTEDWLPPS